MAHAQAKDILPNFVEIIEIWGMILRPWQKAQEITPTLKHRDCSKSLISPHGGLEMEMKLLEPRN